MNKILWPQLPVHALALAMAALAVAIQIEPAFAQKTDIVMLSNGNAVTGEVKEFQRGKMKFSTDAMGTVYVEWPKIVTLTTDKTFEIELEDGTTFFGSMSAAQEPNRLKVIVQRDTFEIATQSVVRLQRIKSTFWRRLDGSIDLGFDFTQQNGKTDLALSGDVKYKMGLRNFKLTYGLTFSRQDSTDDISKLNLRFSYLKQFGYRWFYIGAVSAEENSQLSLDIRGTVGGGIGRYFVQSNKVNFALLGGIGYAREKFTDTEGDNSVPATVGADFQYFSWGDLDTDLSSRLVIMPVLNQLGRWRISFITSFKREVVKDFYFNVSVNEYFDSQPPAEGANKNDLSLTTSFGWSF